MLEELIAFGVKKFVSMGSAGTLQRSLKIGDVVVCDKAIRDEGTSHHYLESSKFAFASEPLTARLEQVLVEKKVEFIKGPSWTVDSPYRETVAEARQYQSEGVLTVEMEASALFAVAQYRNVKVAAAFVVSDSLADLKWSPQFHDERKVKNLELLLECAVLASRL